MKTIETMKFRYWSNRPNVLIKCSNVLPKGFLMLGTHRNLIKPRANSAQYRHAITCKQHWTTERASGA